MTGKTRLSPEELQAFVRSNLPLAAVPGLPQIRLHRAHPGSALRRLADTVPGGLGTPYWAYPWPGGLGLATHLLARPETVAGRRVLDLGAGSGLVGIAAVKAGAARVMAAEIDRNAQAALVLNAAANGVALEIVAHDLTGATPPPVDTVVVGDLFYERRLAHRVTRWLETCRAAAINVLVGDVGRGHLPHARLTPLASYQVPEFGRSGSAVPSTCTIYTFDP